MAPALVLRTRLDEIGSKLTVEELLNLPLFAYLALDGILHVPASLMKILGYLFTAGFWLGTILAFLRNRSRIHWEFWTCRFAFVFLLYTLASAAWGTQPLKGVMVPSITAICTFLYYNYLIDRFSLTDFTRMMVWTFAILLVLSVFASLFFPGYGLDDGSNDPNNLGAWQGVFAQKNQLGAAAALALAVALGLRPTGDVDRVWRWLLIVAALICSYGSQSRETWIAMLLQVVFALFMRLLRTLKPQSRLPILIAGLSAFIGTTLLIYFNLDAAFALVGRTRTASGRTEIWTGCLLLIEKRPWLGYGTYGVWHTPYAWDVVARAGWQVTSSHNNYIEVLLSYGLIGFAIYMTILCSTFLYMFRALLSYDLRDLEVLIYVMISLLVLSMASPLLMYSPAVGMILLLYCVSHLEKIERTGFMRLRH